MSEIQKIKPMSYCPNYKKGTENHRLGVEDPPLFVICVMKEMKVLEKNNPVQEDISRKWMERIDPVSRPRSTRVEWVKPAWALLC